MICTNCTNIKICKIYDSIKGYIGDIELSSCKHSNSFMSPLDNLPKHIMDHSPIIAKEYKNFNMKEETPRKENPLVEELDIKVIRDSEQLGALIVKCPTCDGETTDDDITLCNKCNKVVCCNCSTATSKLGEIFCDACWKDI